MSTSATVAGQNLSAEEVAVRKATAVESGGAEVKEKLVTTRSLEYAAAGVLSKAIDAQNKLGSKATAVDQFAWDKAGGSKKVWNNRCVRTNFTGVDLSGTYRTIFVNCNFDENCVLPKDTNIVGQKYFSNCTFSTGLMDKPKNKDLKASLVKAGMILNEEENLYVTNKLIRDIYDSKDKKGNDAPGVNPKPIESFKFIESIQLVERAGR